jgi:hypothetical protein
MAFKRDGYYYDQQITNYVLQFMAIFSGLQVQIGKWRDESEQLISVPIHYGDQDRVVASILADNTQNKPIRLPIMSAYMQGFELGRDRMHGTGIERRNTYVPVGGLIPDDLKVIHQRQPTPYDMTMELTIWVSNSDQHFQILEQIMPLFDPQLNIQTSDAVFDMARLTSVELKSGPMMDNNYPSGQDRRVIKSTMTFNVPIYISTPAEVKKDVVNRIFMRIGAVSTSANTSEEIVAELDAEGIPYRLVLSAADLPIS